MAPVDTTLLDNNAVETNVNPEGVDPRTLEPMSFSYPRHMTNEYDVKVLMAFKKANKIPGNNINVRHEMLWERWMALTDAEREAYYDQVRNTLIANKAQILFRDGSLVYPNMHLEQEHPYWTNLSPEAKKFFMDGAEAVIVEKEKENPDMYIVDNCFWKKHLVRDMSDLNAEPHPIYSNYIYVRLAEERKALIVYMTKNRPLARNDPTIVFRHHFELNLILEQRWIQMSDEERQPYFTMVRRAQVIAQELKKWSLLPFRIYNEECRPMITSDFNSSDSVGKESESSDSEDDSNGPADWEDVSDNLQNEYKAKALEARARLLEIFPDFNDYYRWMACEDRPGDLI